jgi:hypothetical protein
LVQSLVAQGVAPSAANSQIATSLGIAGNSNLETFDAESAANSGDPIATQVFAAQVQVANILSLVTAAGGSLAAAQTGLAGSLVNNGASILTDASSLATIASQAGADSAAAAVAGSIASTSNSAINADATSNTPDLSTIVALAKVTQGTGANNLATAVSASQTNPNALNNVPTDYTNVPTFTGTPTTLSCSSYSVPLHFAENGTLTVPNGDLISAMTVSIDGGYAPGDSINFYSPAPSTGVIATDNGGTETFTGDASASVYTSILDALAFSFTASDPTQGGVDTARHVTVQATSTQDVQGSLGISIIAPVAPTITGTIANQQTTAEETVTPFSGVAIGDTTANATDTLTVTLVGTGGSLIDGASFIGPKTLGRNGSTYTLTGTAGALSQELDALTFTPTAGQPNSTSTTTFLLSDVSSAYPIPTTDGGASVVDSDPAVAPTITGTVANQGTTSEAPVSPFSGVTIGDANAGGTETVTIALGGTGGRLSDGATFMGTKSLSGSGSSYALTGTAGQVTQELDSLVFKPTAGLPNTTSTTTFTLNVKSSAYATAISDSTTSVIDTDPASNGGTATGGTSTPTKTVSELDPTSQLIERLYLGILDRAGDPSGMTFYDALYNAHATARTLDRIADDMLQSAEFQTTHGTLGNRQFVETLYQSAFGRAAETSALHHDVRELNNGTTRQALAVSIVESPEAIAHLAGNRV